MKNKIYRVDDEDHVCMLIGLLWVVGIIIVLGVINAFC
jgi:hypothetical protein